MLNIESFTKQALLVVLNVKEWTGRKKDKAVESHVNHEYNAHDAGNYSKKLINKKSVSNITTLLSKMKNYHYENTAPWGSGSTRVLPAANFLEYARRIGDFNTELQDEVENLINNYHNVIAEAKVRLGNLFNPADYPSPEELRTKFKISFEIMPVTSVKDIRLDMMEDELNLIKNGYVSQLNTIANETIQCIIKDVINEINTHIQKLADGINLRVNTFHSLEKATEEKLSLIYDVLQRKNIGNLFYDILCYVRSINVEQLKKSHDLKDQVMLDFGRYQSKLETQLTLLQKELEDV